jgi:hypothetical protein
LCFDTEAFIEEEVDEKGQEIGQKHRLGMGTGIYLHRENGRGWNEKSYVFKSVSEFWSLLDSLMVCGTSLYIIAHNTAYDYGLADLDGYIDSRDMVIGKFVIGSSFIVEAGSPEFKWSIKVIDTLNWFKQPLAKMAKFFGLEKGEIENFQIASDEELLPYCMNDTRIVAETVKYYIDFLDKHDLGNFAPTAAGQAFNAYRHRFMKNDIMIHMNQKLYELEQGSYRGGRTDIFKQGEFDDIVKVDINSMYPYIMRNELFPIRPISMAPVKGITVKELQDELYRNFIVGKFMIEINEPAIAIKRDKLIFPVGKFSAYLTTPELSLVMEHGKILECQEVAIYEQDYIFRDYVDYFYDLKTNASDTSIRELSKLFLNSLYGKFGQRQLGGISEVKDEILLEEIKIAQQYSSQGQGNIIYHDGYKLMKIGEKLYRIDSPKHLPSNNSSPIISSAVTAYSRCYLWNLIKVAGLAHVYYCDTDSIFLDRQGYEALDNAGFIDPKELGKLKIEGIGSCILRGPKDYDWFENGSREQMKRTIKGVPKTAIDLGNGQFEYLQWETGIRRYKQNTPGEIHLSKTSKLMSRQYDKGEILNGSVMPYQLDEVANGEFTISKPIIEKSIKEIIPRVARPWSNGALKKAQYVSNLIQINILQAHHLVDLVERTISYDRFDWDVLQGGDLSYHELKSRIQAILGTGDSHELTLSAMLDHQSETERESLARDALSECYTDIFKGRYG